MNEWVFIKIVDAKEREIVCGMLAKNGYEVRFAKRKVEGKSAYVHGIEYREHV